MWYHILLFYFYFISLAGLCFCCVCLHRTEPMTTDSGIPENNETGIESATDYVFTPKLHCIIQHIKLLSITIARAHIIIISTAKSLLI